MSLLDADWERLQAWVLDHWFLPDPPVHQVYFGASEFWAHLELSGSPIARATIFVKAVREAPLADDQCLALKLVEALRATGTFLEQSDIAALSDLRTRLEEEVAKQRAIDPFDAVRLRRNRIFIDRRELRPMLRTWAGSNDHIAFLVGGEPHGKSYTYELLQNVAEARGILVPRVKLDELASADEAIEHLGLSLTTDKQAPKATDPGKRLRLGCRWIVQLAVESGKACWFVLDEYNRVSGQLEFRELVMGLVRQLVEHGSVASRIRLIVLGFEEPLPSDLRGTYTRDQTSKITDSDVRAALRSILLAPAGPLDDESIIDGLTDDAITAAGDNEDIDYARLTRHLEDTILATLG